jgi:2-polyprenyl-6-methoxyphenol hydroxylase-like FAD-dependent oxidoreductase
VTAERRTHRAGRRPTIESSVHDSSSCDVVIAGAGPVGLFLACELRLGGASVMVLEQADDPASPLKRLPFGMRGLSVPTIEALDRRDLLDPIAQASPAHIRPAERASPGAAHWTQQARRPGGHFAGIQFFHDRIDASRWADRVPPLASGPLPTTMEHLESVLAVRASAMGVEIRRGRTVERLDVTEDGVTVHAGGEPIRARWLVGCDGGRSVVRKAGGFAFVGTEPEFTGYSVEVELDAPNALAAGRHYTAAGMYTYQPPGTIALVDFDGGAFHRTEPITRQHVQAVLRRVAGVDATVIALHLAATWTDRAFQATSYRNGRVLLAGDACHIHSPLGGQGLNLGLGDAMNLGWKLASVIRGETPESLLDTYVAERHPIGAQVLDWSRAQVAIMRPTRSSRALEAILRDLIETRDGATYFAERVWGMSSYYELGDGHPMVGRSVPDFALDDGTTVGRRLRQGRGLLLEFDAETSLEAIARPWGERIARCAVRATDSSTPKALLVRPDGVVCWASGTAPHAEAFATAAERWFGHASSVVGGA